MSPAEIFARGVWKLLPDEEDCTWVRVAANTPGSDKPLGDYGPIIKEMLDKGIAPETIARFAKIIAYDAAGSVCYRTEDPSASYEGFPDEEEKLSWLLALIDDNENTIGFISGIHALLSGMDPSGREMRPKKS